jgi:hypothetical protein
MSQVRSKELPMKPDEGTKVKVSDRLSRLPRFRVTSKPAPNAKAARVNDTAYEITSPRRLSEALALKKNLLD